jgi:hypothetical protein
MRVTAFVAVGALTFGAHLPSAYAQRTPLYRWYAAVSTDHFYTITQYDGSQLPGFVLQGIAGYVERTQRVGTEPFWRFYYGSPRTDHFYTTDWSERNIVESFGYVYEGNEGFIYTGQVAGSIPLMRLAWCSGSGD